MRLTTLSLLLLAALVLPCQVHAADTASVHAVLITASKEKAAADPRLAPYEAVLQRNLPESSFRFVGEGNATIAGRGSRVTVNLSSSHSLELESGGHEGDAVAVKVKWLNGKTVVMNNAFTFQPGVPVVLGRRPSGDGDVPIIIVMVR